MAKNTELSWGWAARRLAAVSLPGAALAALTWGAAGCGGLEPGDYLIYRVALSSPARGKNCVADDNIKNDTSTFRSTQTYVLYAGPDDRYYLDTGDTTLEGTGDGDAYTFEGKSVDVEFVGPVGQTDKQTTTLTTDIEMTVDGASATGTVSTTTKVDYACADPAMCPANTACTLTSDFVGTELEDVELEHDPA